MVVGALLLCALSAACSTPVGRDSIVTVDSPERLPTGLVTAVRDGDTLDMEQDGTMLEVRLMGINAPESGECYFDQATEHLRRIVVGRWVGLEEAGIDQFGRALAYLWSNGAPVNLELVADGAAIATTPVEGDPHGADLIAAEEGAFAARIGMWSADACGATGHIPVVAVQVNPNPPGPDEDALEDEQVTFESATRVELDGWTVRDESSAHRCLLPTGSALAPGERLVVDSADPCWDQGGSPVWNNDGDLVLLLDEDGRVIARHRYRG